jgi:hypothetical protein
MSPASEEQVEDEKWSCNDPNMVCCACRVSIITTSTSVLPCSEDQISAAAVTVPNASTYININNNTIGDKSA